MDIYDVTRDIFGFLFPEAYRRLTRNCRALIILPNKALKYNLFYRMNVLFCQGGSSFFFLGGGGRDGGKYSNYTAPRIGRPLLMYATLKLLSLGVFFVLLDGSLIKKKSHL